MKKEELIIKGGNYSVKLILLFVLDINKHLFLFLWFCKMLWFIKKKITSKDYY